MLCFRNGFLWGLGSLLLPPIGLVFCLIYLRDTWKPLLLAVVGWALFFSNADHVVLPR